MRKEEPVIHALLSARSAIDGALSLLGMPAEGEPDNECRHPPEHRQNMTTMGGPDKWQCGVCGHEEVVGDA